MKKGIKLIGLISTLISLVACQDLGAKLSLEEGEKIFNSIVQYVNSNSPKNFTTKSYYVRNKKSDNYYYLGELKGSYENEYKTESYACVDYNKIYMFVRQKGDQKYHIGEDSGTDTYFVENWIYYKDGYVYEVTNDQTSGFDESNPRKYYRATLMDQQAALSYVQEEANDLDNNPTDMLVYNDPKGFSDNMIKVAALSRDVDLAKIERKLDLNYYSKGGEGNLSAIESDNASWNQGAIIAGDEEHKQADFDSAKYKLKLKLNFEKYFFGNGSAKINYSATKDGREIENTEFECSIKTTKGCTITYPNLKEYTQQVEMTKYR